MGIDTGVDLVSSKEMRQHPIGTGPFKLVEFKPNESIKVTRNPDYWKPGRPFLDGIEYTIIRNVSTAILTFVSGKLDITFGGLSVPLTQDVKNQAPQAFCELNPTNVSRNLVINRDVAPFDNPELRRAMALSLDRQAFLDIITEGKGNLGGVMLPRPEGVWGMPPEMLPSLPGYAPDVTKNRQEARDIMQKLGYGPEKHPRGQGVDA
jgi:peptide/nickel transport system substrate-binding protein